MEKLNVVYVAVSSMRASEYNPRRWNEDQINGLRESIQRFGMVDPIICNSAPGREGVVIGGHFRLKVAQDLGLKELPVVYLKIPDLEKEKELNVRLNKNVGSFDFELLKNWGEDFLKDVGFSSEEMDNIFDLDDVVPEKFDLKRELDKLNIKDVKVQKGDRYEIDGSILMCGDSTIEADMLKLMGEHKADMCFTDPPYVLSYLTGKKHHGKATEGFGLKRDRKYLETDVLPDNFTELWTTNVAKVQKPDFSIIIFENPKNLRIIWNELEKHWKYRNTLVWHLPNRVQGFSSRYKFFNKHDIALVGTSGDIALNVVPEEDTLLQQEYENALFATSGKPHWEGYEKGKKIQPTDFIEFIAADEKSSGQGIIFGTKPVEILRPYIKVLTKRDDLILEPFGGSGSTLIAAIQMKRRCFIMEKVPTYVEVIKKRWEKATGKIAKKIN